MFSAEVLIAGIFDVQEGVIAMLFNAYFSQLCSRVHRLKHAVCR
jgi:hypothetical protein